MKNIVIVCLGSEWYNDDIAGLEVCKRLRYTISQYTGNCQVNIVTCETGIERCLGLIYRHNPDVVIFVDAVQVVNYGDVDTKAGDVVIVDLSEITNNEKTTLNIHTHKLPLPIVAQFLKYYCEKLREVLLVGIVVKDLELCLEECELSEEAKYGVEKALNVLNDILREFCGEGIKRRGKVSRG